MEKGVLEFRRIESPSSINTYLQCKRKYYHKYIQHLPGKASIEQIRGKAVHSVLEDFFKQDIKQIKDHEYYDEFRLKLIELFNKHWVIALQELLKLNLDKIRIKEYYVESLHMLNNYLYKFCEKIDKEMKVMSLQEAFNKLKPLTEIKFYSEKYQVQGFVDAISNGDGKVTVWDYKTSKRDKIGEDYYLQLGIYALLYYERYGSYPDKVGINFLLHGERLVEVNEDLINKAKKECEDIHLNTASEDKKDYPQNIGPLCKWSTGQCDYYENCFGQKKLNEFQGKNYSITINKD